MRSRLRPVALMLVCAAKVIIPGALRAHGQDASPTARRDYPVQPVPFTAVHFNDAFWLPRIEVNRTVTIPFAFAKCEETKRVHHFERAAAALRGETLTDKEPPGYPFDDTDVYKVIEGAAYTLSDTSSGECRVPASWRVLFRDGEAWKPVAASGPYGVEKDRYNKVAFAPVTTGGLRLEVVLPPQWSAGIQEWKVR